MNTIIFAVIGVVALLAGLLCLRREKQEVVAAVDRLLEQEGNASDDFDPYAYSNSGEIVGVNVESGSLEDVHGVIAADSQNFDELPVPDSSGYFTLRPDWSKAPEWAMWVAQDESGRVYWYSHEPTCGNGLWVLWHLLSGVERSCPWVREVGPCNPNWKQAIEQRPATIKESSPVQVVKESLTTPERDNCQLIPRDELARLQEAYSIGVRYCKNPASQSNFERLAKAHGVEL